MQDRQYGPEDCPLITESESSSVDGRQPRVEGTQSPNPSINVCEKASTEMTAKPGLGVLPPFNDGDALKSPSHPRRKSYDSIREIQSGMRDKFQHASPGLM